MKDPDLIEQRVARVAHTTFDMLKLEGPEESAIETPLQGLVAIAPHDVDPLRPSEFAAWIESVARGSRHGLTDERVTVARRLVGEIALMAEGRGLTVSAVVEELLDAPNPLRRARARSTEPVIRMERAVG